MGVIRSRAGARHLMANPVVVALRNTDLLIRLPSEWLKGMPIPFRATLFGSAPRIGWCLGIKIRPSPQSADSSTRTGDRGRIRRAPHMLTLRLGRIRELWS